MAAYLRPLPEFQQVAAGTCSVCHQDNGAGMPGVSSFMTEDSLRTLLEQNYAALPNRVVRPGESWPWYLMFSTPSCLSLRDSRFYLQRAHEAQLDILLRAWMINAGGAAVRQLDDGWTVVTEDGSCSAHFEHTVAITDDGPMVLTLE